MKKFAVLLALLATGSPAFAGRDTAYQALRTLGKEKGQGMLNRVVEVEGHAGTPEPAIWKIVIDDPSARSGVREFEISSGRIVSERTPARANFDSNTSKAIDFSKLNLDSAGAFAVVEREAQKSKIGFDSVDYLLRRDNQGTTPVWVLRLMDVQHRSVCTISLASDTGAVLRRSGLSARSSDGDFVDSQPRPTAEEPDESVPRREVGHEIDKVLHRAGGALEEFFTGKRTIDRRFQDEP